MDTFQTRHIADNDQLNTRSQDAFEEPTDEQQAAQPVNPSAREIEGLRRRLALSRTSSLIRTAVVDRLEINPPEPPSVRTLDWARNPAAKNVWQRSSGASLVPQQRVNEFMIQTFDSNALGRLGMQTTGGLMDKATFPVQESVVDALWRDPANPEHTFSQHSLRSLVFTPYSVSLSLLFPRIFLRRHSETMLDEINDLISNQGSAALETAALIGTGANGVPLGLLTEAAQAESAATIQSFSSAGNPTAAELQTMIETLGDQGAGLLSNENGFVVHPQMLTKLRALSDPSGKAPLLTSEGGRTWMLGLPIEVSSSMPVAKVLLLNAKHAVRLLVWEPTPDILIDEFTSRTPQVRVVATLYTNVFLNRTDLVIVGQ